MTAPDELAAQFSLHRPHLLGVAYRLTGSRTDAEDAVQECWLRLAGRTPSGLAEIRELRAWLTTVLGRICLDQLRSATARRERYVGQWLPEPIVAPLDGPASGLGTDPLAAAVQDEGLRMAAMVVLDTLSAQQRVAFVLHDAFALPFTEIGAILDCSPEAARQHASRARRAVRQADPPRRAEPAEQRAVLERLVAALHAGDIAAVTELLHPDAVLIGDSDGKARTARQRIVGSQKLARFLLGVLDRYHPDVLGTGWPVLVNGDLGFWLPAAPGRDGHSDVDEHVQAMTVRDGRIVAVYDIANPDKLTDLDRAGLTAAEPGRRPPR